MENLVNQDNTVITINSGIGLFFAQIMTLNSPMGMGHSNCGVQTDHTVIERISY